MPRIAEDLIGKPIGMYDSEDPDETSLNVLHAVDITDLGGETPKERKLLKFTRDTRGVIVFIYQCYEGESDMGSGTYFHVDDFKEGVPSTDMYYHFHRYARQFGLTSNGLLALIKEHAEAVPST